MATQVDTLYSTTTLNIVQFLKRPTISHGMTDGTRRSAGSIINYIWCWLDMLMMRDRILFLVLCALRLAMVVVLLPGGLIVEDTRILLAQPQYK